MQMKANTNICSQLTSLRLTLYICCFFLLKIKYTLETTPHQYVEILGPPPPAFFFFLQLHSFPLHECTTIYLVLSLLMNI